MNLKRKVFIFIIILIVISCGIGTIVFFGRNNPKKQIILISIDTLRPDHLTPYGYNRDTSPELSQLSRHATVYDNAYVNGCWTMPSHMTMLTGTLPSRHGINVDWGTYAKKKEYPLLNKKVRLISEILKDRGFYTGKVGRLSNELGFGRGFVTNHDLDPFPHKGGFKKIASQLSQNKDKDFFMFIHTWMVHAPYSNSSYLNPDMKSRLGQEKLDFIDYFRQKGGGETRGFKEFMKKNGLWDCQSSIDLYDGGIQFVDQKIKLLIQKCKDLGIFENVMFIVTSDHGEHFGERTPSKFYDSHGWDFYEELIKVPLIIKYPRQKKSARIPRVVSMVDLVPTILDYYHISVPDYIQGESLLKKASINHFVSEATATGGGGEKKMIRMGDFKLIVHMKNIRFPGRLNWEGISSRRLFNLKDDPGEQKNLIKKMIFRKIGFDYERLLIQVVNESVNFGELGETTKIKKETLKFMESLGYL